MRKTPFLNDDLDLVQAALTNVFDTMQLAHNRGTPFNVKAIHEAEEALARLYVQADIGRSPEELEALYSSNGDGEHPKFTRSYWRDCVAEQSTVQGYWNWVSHQLKEL